MKNKIKNAISANKSIIANFSYLSLLQIVTMIVPIITMPYLIIVLGKEKYGLIVFAQTIVQYFLIIVSFGFNISATKDISENRDNIGKLNEIVSSVLLLKGVLFVLSMILLFVILHFIPKAEELRILFYLSMYICFFEWVFPIWYFQGLEEMKYITIVNSLSRFLFLVLIFVFVKEESDYLLVPAINGLGALLGGIISLVILRKDGIKFSLPTRKILWGHINSSTPLFLGSIAGKIKMITNKSLLGLFVGMESVTFYDIADKIKQIFVTFLELFVNAIYPNVARNRNKKLVRLSIRGLFFVGILLYLSTGVLMEIFIPLYANEYSDIIVVFWILGVLIFTQPLSYLIGTNVLILNNEKRSYAINLYWMTLVYLSLILLFYIFYEINMYTLSVSLAISVVIELLSRINMCINRNLTSWII